MIHIFPALENIMQLDSDWWIIGCLNRILPLIVSYQQGVREELSVF